MTRIGHNGFSDIKNHCFYEGIDWIQLETKAIKPPFHLTTETCELDDACKINIISQTQEAVNNKSIVDYYDNFYYAPS